MKRVIITGPTGAIGMALIKNCIKANIEVVAIVNPDSLRKKRLPKNPLLHVLECDVDDYDSFDLEHQLDLIGITTPFDVWFHLAWKGASGKGRDASDMQIKNIVGLLAALELAKRIGCHTFVGVGSQAEYGIADRPLGENAPTKPVTAYGVAKLCAGQMGRLKAEQLGIKFVWTRVFSVYGPYDGENTMIISGIRDLINGKSPKFTKGEQQWDYLYSKDAADILIQLSEHGKHGRIYPVGSGQCRPLYQYIKCMEKAVLESTGRIVHANIGAVPYGEHQIMYLCADITALQEDIGLIELTSFEDGIADTVKWCEKNRY